MPSLPRLALEHRRPLAALCAALAVVTVIGALRDDGSTVAVAVAARDLPSGQVLTADDVTVVGFAAGSVPDGVLDDDALVGRRVGAPMGRGEPFTGRRVLDAAPLDERGDGLVVATVRLADASATQGLRVGDRVDVVAVSATSSGGPRADVVAESLEVAALPGPGDEEAAGVLVLAPREVALDLARVALDSRMSVLASGGAA